MSENEVRKEAIYLICREFDLNDIRLELNKLNANQDVIKAVQKDLVIYNGQLEAAKRRRSESLFYVVIGGMSVVFGLFILFFSRSLLLYGLMFSGAFAVLKNYPVYKAPLEDSIGIGPSIRRKRIRG